MGRVKNDANEKTDLDILRILSMNGRASLDFIGKKVGLSKHPTYRRIKALEEKYGIRYLSEIDISKFGFFGYVAMVRFKNKIPSLKELHQVFDKDPLVQLVLITTGKYDMVIYFVSDNHKDVAYFIYDLKTKTSLSNYSAYWYVTPQYGLIYPLMIRDQFFELLSKKVWHKTKYKKRPESGELIEREFNVLRELNRDGAVNFNYIDRKHNLATGASRYTYLKLKERGILKRVTITLDRLPIKYNAIFIIGSFLGKQFVKARPYLLEEIIREGPLINKYVWASDIGIPAGSMLIAPVFTDDQVKQTEDYFENKIKGASMKKLIVTNTVINSFIYRRFDMEYTNQHYLLTNEYKLIKPKEKEVYEEMPTDNRNATEILFNNDKVQ